MKKIDANNNCFNCHHAQELEITEDLKRNLQCIKNPPTPLAIATPQGIMNITTFPVVNNKMICSKFSMKPTIIN